MRSILLLTSLCALLSGAAPPALAQTLSPRDGTAWEPVGQVDYFQYFVDPSSVVREDGLVRVVIRAFAAPSSDDGINTVVARLAIDCAARTIAVEARDYYREARGFAMSQGPMPGGLAAPTDPGQELVIAHVCPATD